MQPLLPEGTKRGNPYREILSGTFVVDLTMFADKRGTIAELYRTSWLKTPTVQWNHTFNKATVMRGAHAHLTRNEHVIIAHGKSVFGVHDARPGSPTEGKAVMLNLSADKLQMLFIPSGVVHSVYAQTDSIMLVGQDSYYRREDEYDCFYNDPLLNFAWPVTDTSKMIMTQRDLTAGPLTALKKVVPKWTPARVDVGAVPLAAPVVAN